MKLKTFLKFFIPLFLVFFLAINWNQISWIFNYRVVSGLVEDFSEKKTLETKTSEVENLVSLSNEVLEKENFVFSEKENILEIPKIGISVPLIFVESFEQKEIEKGLNLGVVHFSESSLPGQKGQTIILGHSAPPGWPRIKYDWVFTRINELEKNDEVIIYFDNKKLIYSVTNMFFLERGDEVPKNLITSENSLILISCWPPGKDIRRIALEAILK